MEKSRRDDDILDHQLDAEMFVYCSSVRKLWQELKEQYGESNGPQVYQIQRQIALIKQGNQSIVTYYSRLKRLWEELNVLQPMPYCECTNLTGYCAVLLESSQTSSRRTN